MRRLGNVQVLFIFVSVVVPTTYCQTTLNNGRVRHFTPDTDDGRPEKETEVRLKGFCRDGWTVGSMPDGSGRDTPICLKINSRALTWEDAKSACRKDYGFLMRLDSVVKWGDDDLLSVLVEEGITYTWTGIHTGHHRLVWDDLIPSQVKPTERLGNSSSAVRPWKWARSNVVSKPEYCGYMHIDPNLGDRKKRASDDDLPDSLVNFDFSGARMFRSNYRPQLSMLNFPKTSAFKSELSRTQLSDQLTGLQSVLQIPGSGLSGANIQRGGLSATLMPNFESAKQADGEENKDAQSPFEAVENLNKEIANIANTMDLMNAVKDDDASVHDMSPLSPLETLIGHVKEMQNIQLDSSGSENKLSSVDVVKDMVENVDSVLALTTPSLIDSMNKDLLEQINDNKPITDDVVPDSVGESSADTPVNESSAIVNDNAVTDPVMKDTDTDDSNSLTDILLRMKDILDSSDTNFTSSNFQETESSSTTATNDTTTKTESTSISTPITTTAGYRPTESVHTLTLQTETVHTDNGDNDDDSDNNVQVQNVTVPEETKFLHTPTVSPLIISTTVPEDKNVVDKDEADIQITTLQPNIEITRNDDIDTSAVFTEEIDDQSNMQKNKDKTTHRDADTHTVDNDEKDSQSTTDKQNDDQTSQSMGLVTSTNEPTTQLVRLFDSTTHIDDADDSDRTGNTITPDDESDRSDKPVTSVSMSDVIDMFTMSTPGEDEDDGENDRVDLTTESIDRDVSRVENTTDDKDKNDDYTEKRHKTMEGIAETFSNYLSLFSNDSDASTADTDDLDMEHDVLHVTTPVSSGTDDDDINEGLEDMIEHFMTNETGDDVAEDNTDKETNTFFSEGVHGDPLLDSIMDIKDAILGRTESDNVTDNDDNDTNTSEINVDDSGLNDDDKYTTRSPDDDVHNDNNDTDKDHSFNDVLDNVRENDGQDFDNIDIDDDNKTREPQRDNDNDINDISETLSNVDNEDVVGMNIDGHDVVDDRHNDTFEQDQLEVDDTIEDRLSDAKEDIIPDKGDDLDLPDDTISDKTPQNEDLDDGTSEMERVDDASIHRRPDDANKDDTYEQEIVRSNVDDLIEHDNDGSDVRSDEDFKDEKHFGKEAENTENDDDDEDLSDIKKEMQTPGTLEQIVTKETTRIPLKVPQYTSEMTLGSCETRLPSVCFSYEVEVMAKSSTCDNGWYGHVLLDTCFKILGGKMNYRKAETTCSSFGARVVWGDSDFQRRFVLTAVQKEGRFHRGEKFWKESRSIQTEGCSYFSERDSNVATSCQAAHRVVCIKDAKSLSVHVADEDPLLGFDSYGDEDKFEFATFQSLDYPLVCDLTSAASEFPVLWFKDGVLVKTLDKYVSHDISLLLNDNMLDVVSHVTNTNVSMPVLQGKYWCEVWDRKSLTRKRSRGYDIRFSDVISFHGSMELRGFNHNQEVMFNMVNQRFESLKRTEMDIKRVFKDVLPRLQQFSPDVTSVYTYADSVRTKPSVIEYHTYFTLTREYTIEDEDIVYNRLKALLRSQLGNRRYMARLQGGTPVQAFRTMSLQSTVSCPATSLQTNKDMFGKTIPLTSFSFPKALMGEFANSITNCSERNRLPAGTARCLGDFHTGAYWGDVVANECSDETGIDDVNEELWGISPFTQQLAQMSEIPVNKKNVEDIVQDIAHIADIATQFTPSDINKIADILDHSTQLPELSEQVGENIVRTVNKVIEMEEKKVRIANLETKAANRILKSVERFADNIELKTKANTRIVSDNVVVEIWDLKPFARPVIGLAAESRLEADLDKPFKTEKIATVFDSSQLYDIDVDAAIELPEEVFERQEKGSSIANRLTMVVFRNSKLFDAAVRRNDTDAAGQRTQVLNSYIISASIAGRKISGLTDKVRTIFRPLQESDKIRQCVWWDFMMNDFKGGWSNKGCRYDGKMNGRDVCLCDHLTNFAVLLDFYGQGKPIEDHHELSLSIITVVGLSFSILGLSLTIISYIFFRKLRQGRAQQTLFNLSLALLFSMMVFLMGIKQTHNHHLCLIVAATLHYFILVSFMWMLMEAMLQYLTFVKILGTYITRFTMKTVLPCWGLPMIPVIAVLSVDYNLYDGGPNYCWMSLPAFYYAFTIPISLIILINVVIFFITIVSIFRRGKGLRSNQKKQKMAMTNLQAAITSFILLGLTWMFGYLAISDARITFQYIFTILNSLQGFFIFILFVLRKKKVRDQWYIICCRGSEKDRVSRSLSASNSIPSSCSSGSRNSRVKGERDRSDSTKTVQSTYSTSSSNTGFTNYGYETGFDTPFNRYDKRYFRQF